MRIKFWSWKLGSIWSRWATSYRTLRTLRDERIRRLWMLEWWLRVVGRHLRLRHRHAHAMWLTEHHAIWMACRCKALLELLVLLVGRWHMCKAWIKARRVIGAKGRLPKYIRRGYSDVTLLLVLHPWRRERELWWLILRLRHRWLPYVLCLRSLGLPWEGVDLLEWRMWQLTAIHRL